MKKLLLLSGMLISLSTFAQQNEITPLKITKDHYTMSGGLLAGANYSQFRLGSNSPVTSNKWKFGYAGGVWLNFPISRKFSIEPQGLYSLVGGKYVYNGSVNQDLGYISVPVFLKFDLSKSLALMAGPQVDFLMNGEEKESGIGNKGAYNKNDIAATGGLELFPHGRVSIYARYSYGFTNVSKADFVPEMYNQNIQAGLKLKLFGKHIAADSDGDGIKDDVDKCPNVPGLQRYQGCPIPDTDGDGINDEIDKCPTVAGVAKYNGCPIPDTDGDGINDELDKCPTVAGVAKYQGCPIPDTDGDGINDEEDKCPTVAGVAKYQGCPIPDTDGDGVNDENDRCPTVAGPADNGGCPVIENFHSNRVTFASGKSVLTKSGKKELDLAIAYLDKYPDVNVKLTGYTDSTGSDKINTPLSEKRAQAAMEYLVSKGIASSRLIAEGQGAANPVSSNKTVAGRAENRRVEIKVQ